MRLAWLLPTMSTPPVNQTCTYQLISHPGKSKSRTIHVRQDSLSLFPQWGLHFNVMMVDRLPFHSLSEPIPERK